MLRVSLGGNVVVMRLASNRGGEPREGALYVILCLALQAQWSDPGRAAPELCEWAYGGLRQTQDESRV